MSQPCGTGYGINPFGKACSLHTSTTNTRVSTEHECLGSPVQKNSLSDVVLAQIDCQFLKPTGIASLLQSSIEFFSISLRLSQR